MATIYADASDVLARWVGTGKPADTGQVTVLIEDAETIIAGEFPDLADRVADEDGITADQVKIVVVHMVMRYFRNPEGIRTRSDSTSDQFGGTVTYAGDNPGALALTKEERALLTKPVAAGFGGINTVGTTRGPLETAPIVSGWGLATDTIEETDPYSLWGPYPG